ncbi:uncharacterized protein [Antennarius striatus]|uniref:uncharacterized protein n=1 Tax=Antennarius striatus TaxID=241820 RepID=UPI0035B10D92
MAAGVEIEDLVADLLARPFSTRAFEEKLAVVRRGRPVPELPNLSQAGKGFVRHFQRTNYERYPWLTGSVGRCRLFCWECLLFATDRCGAWSHTGFANLGCLTKAALKHQITVGHLYATVLLKTFADTGVDAQPSEQVRREGELHNEKVKKNREILRRLIDCVVFLGKRELLFRGDDESTQSRNRGNYTELVSFLSEHDTDLHYHLSTNRAFTETPDKIQNDIIHAVSQVIVEEIKKEIKDAPFVALMVDETSDVRKDAQLALALRYVTESGVTERFVRYDEVPRGRRADDVAALIFSILEEYECGLDKVVAQCYDGATVMASGLNEVQVKVKEKAPMALFIHCHAHRLNLVLTQGVSKLKECKVFFANLNGFAAFFSRSPVRTRLLDEMCRRRLPHVAPTRWQKASKVVKAVLERRVGLQELFDHILDHHDEHDQDTVLHADEFNKLLSDFDFCFLLNTFDGIFVRAAVLFGILQKKTFDVQVCMTKVDEFCDAIERGRDRFHQMYEKTVSILGGPSHHRVQDDLRSHYQQLHSNILDNLLCQMRNRFQDHEKLLFLSLLDPQNFKTNRKKFPHTAFSCLTQSHGALFDLPRLKTELTVMYTMSDFEGRSPADLLDFLRSNKLSDSMGQLYALACLAVTIPVSTASSEGSFSTLERIQTYARNTTGQTRLSALASMSVEKDLLLELKRKDKLYDQVIQQFLRKERRPDFVFETHGLNSCFERPQHPVCKEEEVPADHLQRVNSSVNQRNAELLHPEEEKLHSSQEGEQLEVKQETDAVMLTPTYEQNDHGAARMESVPNMPVISSVVGAVNIHLLITNSQDERGSRKDAEIEPQLQSQGTSNTSKKPYVCKICKKGYTKRNDLNVHMRFHTGEKPYGCKACGRHFRETTKLTFHMRTHAGKKVSM